MRPHIIGRRPGNAHWTYARHCSALDVALDQRRDDLQANEEALRTRAQDAARQARERRVAERRIRALEDLARQLEQVRPGAANPRPGAARR